MTGHLKMIYSRVMLCGIFRGWCSQLGTGEALRLKCGYCAGAPVGKPFMRSASLMIYK